MRKKRGLRDEYRFPGFYPKAGIQGMFGDPKARIVTLVRRQKKQFVVLAELFIGVFTIERGDEFGIYPAGMPGYIWMWKFGGFFVGGAGK